MTPERIKEATAKYSDNLIRYGATPQRYSDALVQHAEVRHSTPLQDLENCRLHRHNHLLWMCNELDKIVDEGRMEKAMRWLGFIQGALWEKGFFTIEELKKDNAPPDTLIDAERV